MTLLYFPHSSNLDSLLPIFILSWWICCLFHYKNRRGQQRTYMCFLGDIFLFTCLCAHIRYSITLLLWINIHTLGNDLPLPCALDPVIFPSSSRSYSSLPLTHLLFILWWVFLITIQTSYLFFHFKIILFIFLSTFNLAYLSLYRKTPWKTYLY